MNKQKIIIIMAVIVFIIAAVWFVVSTTSKDNIVNKNVENIDFSLKRVLDEKKLKVGMSMPYGFMEFLNEEGNPDGYDVDVIKEVARKLGVEVEISNFEWDDLFTSVKTEKVDIGISAIAINAERQEEMLFTDPYFNAGQSIIVRKNDDSIKTEKDLINKKVGSQSGTTCIEEARKYTKSEFLKEYKETEDAEKRGTMVYDLRKGDIDAIIIGYEAAVGIVKVRSDELKLAGNPFTNDFSGIISNKENKELVKEINKILREMKRNGSLTEILKKWFE